MIAYIIVFIMGLAVGWWVGWNFCFLGVKENLKKGKLIWTGKK